MRSTAPPTRALLIRYAIEHEGGLRLLLGRVAATATAAAAAEAVAEDCSRLRRSGGAARGRGGAAHAQQPLLAVLIYNNATRYCVVHFPPFSAFSIAACRAAAAKAAAGPGVRLP